MSGEAENICRLIRPGNRLAQTVRHGKGIGCRLIKEGKLGFVEGEPGRSADVRIDDVEFIYRERG